VKGRGEGLDSRKAFLLAAALDLDRREVFPTSEDEIDLMPPFAPVADLDARPAGAIDEMCPDCRLDDAPPDSLD